MFLEYVLVTCQNIFTHLSILPRLFPHSPFQSKLFSYPSLLETTNLSLSVTLKESCSIYSFCVSIYSFVSFLSLSVMPLRWLLLITFSLYGYTLFGYPLISLLGFFFFFQFVADVTFWYTFCYHKWTSMQSRVVLCMYISFHFSGVFWSGSTIFHSFNNKWKF